MHLETESTAGSLFTRLLTRAISHEISRRDAARIQMSPRNRTGPLLMVRFELGPTEGGEKSGPRGRIARKLGPRSLPARY